MFNPLAWARDDMVEIRGDGNVPAALEDAATGERVATQALGDKYVFLARSVPGLGYRTYVPAQAVPAPPAFRSIARQTRSRICFLRVQLDPARGTLRSLVDKKSGRELIDSESEFGFGQYLYERFSKTRSTAT